MAIRLPFVARPNGKRYQPRKISVAMWDNEGAGFYDDYGVFVLGTHDVEFAAPLATDVIQREWDRDLVAVEPETCWVRSAYRDGVPMWIDDPEHGRAAVRFRADYPPTPTERNTQ